MTVGFRFRRDAFAPQFIKPLRGETLKGFGRNQQRLHLQQGLVLGDGRGDIAGPFQRLSKTPMPFRFARGLWIDDEPSPEGSDGDLMPTLALRRGDIGPQTVFGFNGRIGGGR